MAKPAPALTGTARAPIAVGLPVYNGEPYLDTALKAVLDQQGVDFELWIGDNCSTDGTEEICREAARAAGLSKRITVHTLRHSFSEGIK